MMICRDIQHQCKMYFLIAGTCLFALVTFHCGGRGNIKGKNNEQLTETPVPDAASEKTSPDTTPADTLSDASDTSPDATPGDGWKSLGKASFNCNERGVPGVDTLPTKIDTSLKGKQMLNFVYKGDNRPYILHLPTGYDHRSPRPLVFVFHAGVWQVDAYYKSKADLRAKADATNTILVYPQGVGLVWNAAHCCAKAYVCEIDDIGFVKALLADVQAQLKIDATHIHAMGHSNGGMMIHRVATELSDLFASVAAGASTIGGKYAPTSPLTMVSDAKAPIPILMYHGKGDKNVSYNGGVTQSDDIGREDIAFEETVKFWLKQNQCPGTSTQSKDGKAEIRTFTGCKGADVVAIPINGLGHAWPDPAELDGFSHVDTIFKFFNDHPKK